MQLIQKLNNGTLTDKVLIHNEFIVLDIFPLRSSQCRAQKGRMTLNPVDLVNFVALADYGIPHEAHTFLSSARSGVSGEKCIGRSTNNDPLP